MTAFQRYYTLKYRTPTQPVGVNVGWAVPREWLDTGTAVFPVGEGVTLDGPDVGALVESAVGLPVTDAGVELG